MGFFILQNFKIKNYLQLRFIVALLLLCVFAVSSCRTEQTQTGSNSATQEFTDDLGNKINLPSEVTRAVSLAPNLTEIIFAVDAGDKLVGVTTFCNYPENAENIQKVGDTLKPNIENIVALKPDVVFVTTASQLKAFTATLEEQNIKVFVTNPNSLKDIYKSIDKLGEILGKKENAENVVTKLKQRVAEIEAKTKDVEKVRTFVQLDKTLYTIGKTAFLTDIVIKAGGVSVTNDVPMGFPKISKENAVELNPDAIILSDSPDNNEPNDAFGNSNAVKNKKVYKINADILSRPAPRIVDALEQIAKSLHPDKFE